MFWNLPKYWKFPIIFAKFWKIRKSGNLKISSIFEIFEEILIFNDFSKQNFKTFTNIGGGAIRIHEAATPWQASCLVNLVLPQTRLDAPPPSRGKSPKQKAGLWEQRKNLTNKGSGYNVRWQIYEVPMHPTKQINLGLSTQN